MTCTPYQIGPTRCIQCLAVTAVTAVPAQTIYTNVYGWNASAYSVARKAGDCYVQFDCPYVTGVVCGLAGERKSNDPRDIPFGFYLYTSAGAYWWQVAEAGVAKTSAVRRTVNTDVFRIERTRDMVTYYVNGRRVYQSLTRYAGDVVVVSNMYVTGDGVN